MPLVPLLWLAGALTLALGTAHIILPALLDYRGALLERPAEEPPPRPFRLWPTRYVARPTDRYGIIWVMNGAASYVLLSIGLVDLLGAHWLAGGGGGWVALWIAGWWFLRAGNQLWLGRRVGDWGIFAGFALLGALHLLAGLR